MYFVLCIEINLWSSFLFFSSTKSLFTSFLSAEAQRLAWEIQ